MRRFVGSALVATIIGIAFGVYLGWEQFPASAQDSAMCQLSQDYREQYTLMVARGYQVDENRDSALRRLLPMRAENDSRCDGDLATEIDNIPAWVQEVTERYRTRGADIRDICHLAALSGAFGRQIPGYADRPGTVCDQYLPSRAN